MWTPDKIGVHLKREMARFNIQNALKAALLFTLSLVGVYGLNSVANETQMQSDSLSAKSAAGTS